MKTHIVKIGNSQGIRIPKVLLEQSSIENEVELEVINNKLIITPTTMPRHNWKKAFRSTTEQCENKKLQEWTKLKNKWDKTEWEW